MKFRNKKTGKIVEWDCICINSSLLSGQQRKRLYWTNIKNIEQPKDKGIVVKDILDDNINVENSNYKKLTKTLTLITNPIRIGHFNKGSQGDRIYSIEGKSVCLNANGGGGGAKTGLYKIKSSDSDYTIRKLTPAECEKLQTLPDRYTEGISNTQRYKCIGNAWTVDIIAHILKHIKP